MRTPRKYLVHYIDAAFDTTYAATDYQLLGADLDTFSIEMNPQVESKQNILGESSVVHSGYEVSSSVDTFYHDVKKTLETKIIELAMERAIGDQCKTSYVEVLYQDGATDDAPPVVISAYREDVLTIPKSYGGDTTGVQVPFDIHYCGNRTKGSFDRESRKFTAG